MTGMDVLKGRYNDGRVARTHDVSVLIGPDGLAILGDEDRVLDRWPTDTLVLLDRPGRARPAVLGSTARDDARLSFADPAALARLRQAVPVLPAHRPGRATGVRIAAWGLAAAAAVAVIVLVLIPRLAEQIAAVIPAPVEEALGARVGDRVVWVLARLDGRSAAEIACRDPEGVAALDALEDRLVQALDGDRGFAIRLVDAGLVNAFAMPGGHIIVTSGMVEFARTPEALAGVLAHEIGHAMLRHPTEGLLRDTATAVMVGLVVGDFMGGAVVASLGEQILTADYSREAERAADDFAIDLLGRAAIDPGPSAGLFERLAEREPRSGTPLDLFASHPSSAERADRFRAAAAAGAPPALPPEAWSALRRACG